ncbi:MAG: GAF domain-containing protein [Jaaginema sp. PMC 1079.18]|nr:GAF domain-containing protein [Jaaginema sp. PMC 1080.18]MEC4852825.1 GAF domain-containing protein [Jaaginema sp. PMC 1079.18]MEC4868988.1 GAF domain-containing protein [Jaaginema sp. PMC 1078.18]
MPDPGLQRLTEQLASKLEKDSLIQSTVQQLQKSLQVDRILLYYFYQKWEGQVTFESLSHTDFSIFGSSGPDECFNDEYAQLYLEGRVRAIPDIETELIAECHRDFLRDLQVRANLVVPVLSQGSLWGLLIAHSCTQSRAWSKIDIETMLKGANLLATSPVILENSQSKLSKLS